MNELVDYLKNAKSPYHVTEYVKEKLEKAGFTELKSEEAFELSEGGKYYCRPYPRALFAFRIPERAEKVGIRIACAHTDSPTFRVKPSPECASSAGIRKINVEPYGGSLKRTWFDRPLGLAGMIYIKGENAFAPKPVLFDSGEPWFIIPSLAPHMDREIEEKKLDPQKELLPAYALAKEGENGGDSSLLSRIAEKAGIGKEDILDFDLELYLCEEPVICGPDKEFLLSPRIDNIASVAALTEGIMGGGAADTSGEDSTISMIALFDNEEIGSRTKQGADSGILNFVIDRIFESKLFGDISKNSAIMRSRILSVDGAHAQHPNYPEKADETARALLGKGIVLKNSASQRYVTDPEMGAILLALCSGNGIMVQRQANRSGAPGGQTLGPIISSYLPVPAADLGIPMLAMHSSNETMCLKDYEALEKLMKVWLV